MATTPSIGRILKNDFAAFLLAIGGPIAFSIATYAGLTGSIPKFRRYAGRLIDRDDALEITLGASLVTVLLLFFLFRRISRIKRVLASGPRTMAKVAGLEFHKDRGRLEFEYEHLGIPYRAGVGVMKNRQTTAIAIGDSIEVAVDPAEPGKALVVALYCA